MVTESVLAKLSAKGMIDNQANRHIIDKTISDPFSAVIRDGKTKRLLVLLGVQG